MVIIGTRMIIKLFIARRKNKKSEKDKFITKSKLRFLAKSTALST